MFEAEDRRCSAACIILIVFNFFYRHVRTQALRAWPLMPWGILGASPLGPPFFLCNTKTSGRCKVLIGDVEDRGCDSRPGGLGGGAPLSTTRIYKLIQFQT